MRTKKSRVGEVEADQSKSRSDNQNEEDEGRRGQIRVEVEMDVVDGVKCKVRSCRRCQIVDTTSPTKSILVGEAKGCCRRRVCDYNICKKKEGED